VVFYSHGVSPGVVMFRKLLGAYVGLAMMGMAGTASATLITKTYDYDGNIY
jgi:hypothetical protein